MGYLVHNVNTKDTFKTFEFNANFDCLYSLCKIYSITYKKLRVNSKTLPRA